MMGAWYRRVWRWHFYAGLVALPFVLILSLTGMVFLFKPSLDAWSERGYDHLALQGEAHSLDEQVSAARAALPSARVKALEWRADSADAARVLMVDGAGTPYRVYVRPDDLRVLATEPESNRISELARKIHGELLAGEAGAILIETIGGWGIVLFGTGLYLWWPRVGGLAGVVYPRLSGGRIWRDLHAVTGFWISIFALFFLISALPWTKVWGGGLKQAQAHFTSTQGDWTTGPASEHAMHHHDFTEASTVSAIGFDRVAAQAAKLDLAGPVLLLPPSGKQRNWTIKSDSQDRTVRRSVEIDPATGGVVASSGFGDRPLIDRIVGVTTSIHEGHLFGPLNQLFGMVTGLSLCLMVISAAALWLKRKRPGLGAPPPVTDARWAPLAGACVLAVAVLLPTLGLSLAAIMVLEWLVLRRIAPVARWLGLTVR